MDTPETESLFFETLDHLGHSKTYAVDKQVVDSASSATAMFTGVKTKYGTVAVYLILVPSIDCLPLSSMYTVGTLGFDSHIERGYPETMDESIEATSILALAQEVGMATGTSHRKNCFNYCTFSTFDFFLQAL